MDFIKSAGGKNMIKDCKNKFIKFLATISSIISISAFIMFFPELVINNSENICLIATSFVLPHNISLPHINNCSKKNKKADIFSDLMILENKPNSNKRENICSDDNNILEIINSVPNFELHHEVNEPTKKIIECSFGATGTQYENIFINNKTNVDINIPEILNERPDINIKKDGTPQVLIIHTHTTEAYIDKDQGFYYQSFSPRTRDNNYNVVKVGDAICKSLENSGIKCLHDTTCHDDPAYTGSYKRSEETISKNLKKYPSIQVVLDIHRDTIDNKEKSKIKPTFTYNNRKGAQIMIISGCDENGKLDFPDWKYNLRFALRLHKQVESMYPGMTRALLFKEARYNMHKTHGSLLIEVGSDVNTLNEAVYSAALLGKALGSVLNSLT